VVRLRRLAEALVDGRPPERDDAVPVGRALLDYLDGGDLERRLGLADGRPGPGWRCRERLAERDALIRELAGLYQGSPTARGQEMSRDLRHYATAGWLHDKSRGDPWPDTPKRRLMFAIHSTDPDKPPPTGIVRLLAIMRGE
jgi:hypothetical protein